MAEARNVWQDLLAAQHHAITTAFRELAQRWRGIFDQEGARWSQAGRAWQLARGQDGQLRWDGYPKTFEETIKDFQQALHDMREATAMRLPWEAYSGHGSYMSGPSPERQTHDHWVPARGTVAYVEWVVRDTIRTGLEEGYPLSAEQIEHIRQRVWNEEIGQDHASAWDQGRGEGLQSPVAGELDRIAAQLQANSERMVELEAALQDVHPHSAEFLDMQAELSDLRAGVVGEREELCSVGDDEEGERPEWMDVLQEFGRQVQRLDDQRQGLEVDTSDPEMGVAWQQTLEQLQARLDALERDFPDQDLAQGHNDHNHDEGMGY